MVQQWLEWSHLQVKVPRCPSLGIRASTEKTVDPGISIVGKGIPSVGDNNFKFLGMLVGVHNDNTTAKSLKRNLQRMLEAIDQAPVTEIKTSTL